MIVKGQVAKEEHDGVIAKNGQSAGEELECMIAKCQMSEENIDGITRPRWRESQLYSQGGMRVNSF